MSVIHSPMGNISRDSAHLPMNKIFCDYLNGGTATADTSSLAGFMGRERLLDDYN